MYKRQLKDCGETRIYISRPVVEVEAAGFEVLGGLLEAFVTTVNDIAHHGAAASSLSLIHIYSFLDRQAPKGQAEIVSLTLAGNPRIAQQGLRHAAQ